MRSRQGVFPPKRQVAGSTVGVEPRTPQKLSLAMGLVISVGAETIRRIKALLVLLLPFLMVAAEPSTVNEFREGCCQVSNKKV
jgi:hypothetical protein